MSNWKGVKNIGVKLASRLDKVGIHSTAELKKFGIGNVYKKMSLEFQEKLPVCYYLYSLEGAVLGLHWDKIPKNRKIELLKEIKT